jgi:hypothetical protein
MADQYSAKVLFPSPGSAATAATATATAAAAPTIATIATTATAAVAATVVAAAAASAFAIVARPVLLWCPSRPHTLMALAPWRRWHHRQLPYQLLLHGRRVLVHP